MIKNLFIIIFFLLAGSSSCQVANAPKTIVSECDSIRLKLGENWRYYKSSYITNAEFVKRIISDKACFLNKDTNEITQIFGKDFKLGSYSIRQKGLYYFGSFYNKDGAYLIFVLGKDNRVADVVPLFLDIKANNVTNNPKPLPFFCDSIILKIGDNWRYSNKVYTSNANFIKGIVKSKDCFIGKDSLEIGNIFGVNHTLMRYKKVQDALYYDVKFNRESGVALFFVLDDNGRLEDIDPVYLEAGETVK